MRIFTEKEITGFTRAFQAMMNSLCGQRKTITTLLPLVGRALDSGVTIDELLNPGNFERLRATTPTADPECYIDALIDREMLVLPLKENENWDNPATFPLIAEIFHAFFLEICPKGGTWNTDNARSNLRKAILRFSLQTIMSESTILEMLTAPEGTDLTCFQYIRTLLNDAESFALDASLTEAQEKRRTLAEQTSAEEVPGDGDAAGRDDPEHDVDTEGAPEGTDGSIYNGPEDEAASAGKGNPDDIAGESAIALDPEGTEYDGNGDGFISSVDPTAFKRQCIADIILGLTVSEITELARVVKDDVTLDEFIDELAKGNVDKEKESPKAHNAHQYLVSELYRFYLQCMRMQNRDVDESEAAQTDTLMANWDMRDSRTRKFQKIKDLIFKESKLSEENDQDLIDVLADLEKIYEID